MPPTPDRQKCVEALRVPRKSSFSGLGPGFVPNLGSRGLGPEARGPRKSSFSGLGPGFVPNLSSRGLEPNPGSGRRPGARENPHPGSGRRPGARENPLFPVWGAGLCLTWARGPRKSSFSSLGRGFVPNLGRGFVPNLGSARKPGALENPLFPTWEAGLGGLCLTWAQEGSRQP